MNEPLPVLAEGRSLLAFARDKTSGVNSVPDLEKDHRYTKAIARYLLLKKMNNDYQEAINNPADLIRLVPAAAQIAVQKVETDHLQQFENIHNNALALTLQLKEKAQMNFLAAGPGAHDAYLDSLINRLNFTAIRIE
jgi:hypothetical protein